MKKIRIAILAILAFVLSLIGAVTAYADPSATVDTTQIMQTTMTSLVGEIMGVIAVVVPIAMGLVGAVIAIKFGIRFIKSLVGK